MSHIQEIEENIKRLKATIKTGGWNQGYINNCKSQLAFYEKRLRELTQ